MRCRSTATFSFGATAQVQRALRPYPQGRRGAGRLQPYPSELRHKYNVCSIAIRKDDEVQVDCNLLLRSYDTSTTSAPALSARTTRCMSTKTFFCGATSQVQRPLHPYPQGRRGAGRLPPSPSELGTNTTSAPSVSARTKRCSKQSPSEGKHKHIRR